MATEDFEFLAPTGFEWNEEKSKANLIKHGIDFEDASEVFYGPVILRGSNRNSEERWIAIGKSHDRVLSVIYPPEQLDQDHFSAPSETK